MRNPSMSRNFTPGMSFSCFLPWIAAYAGPVRRSIRAGATHYGKEMNMMSEK